MTTKGAILRAIREYCLKCCCGSYSEVEKCRVGEKCQLYLFQFGKDPEPSRKSNFPKTSLPQNEILKNPTDLRANIGSSKE